MSQTHSIAVSGETLTKTYVDWSRGEPVAEWHTLTRVSAFAPDLVPRPVAADLGATPPTVTMTRVPGTPLSGALTRPQRSALATALATLWSVPVGDIARRRLVDFTPVREALATVTAVPVPVKRACAAAVAWLDGPEPAVLDAESGRPVIGHGDPNLTNYLWDGHRIRIVDFEDASRSDVATELALLLEHLSSRDTDWSDVLAAFPTDAARLRAARRRWSIFWLYLLRPDGPAARRNPLSALTAQATRVLDLLGP
jgi:aminoglycoside phosphotransferase (APT) family kinase protein